MLWCTITVVSVDLVLHYRLQASALIRFRVSGMSFSRLAASALSVAWSLHAGPAEAEVVKLNSPLVAGGDVTGLFFVGAANADFTVNLEPGTTSETFAGPDALGKALELRNNDPGRGSVIIGQPGARHVQASGAEGGFISRGRMAE